ncbi:MAG: hypothetical protein KKH49_05430, partial [Candidatus Omnitrophica bacterium]|nr:hypothetical protein [Candidatus Omnitrophota bacterium]
MSECYLRNRLNRFLSKKSALIITLVLIVFFVGSQEAFADITYGTGNYSGYYGNSGVITIAAGAVITLTGSVIFAAGSSFIMDSGSSIVCGSNYPLTITSGGASTLRTITLGAGGGIFLGRASAAPTYTTNNTITCGGALTVNAGGFPLNLNNDLNCGGISINSGSSVTVTGSPTITVNGNWTNMGGTFNAGSSTVIFNSTITGRTIRTNNSAFSTLTINGSGGYWTLNTNNLTAATL